MSSIERHSPSPSDSLRDLQARFENASIEELTEQAERFREVAPELSAGFALVGLQSIAGIGLFVDDLPGTAPGDRIKRGGDFGAEGDAQNPEAFVSFEAPKPWERKWLVLAIKAAQVYWKMNAQTCEKVQRYLDRKTFQDWRKGNIHEGYHIDCSRS